MAFQAMPKDHRWRSLLKTPRHFNFVWSSMRAPAELPIAFGFSMRRCRLAGTQAVLHETVSPVSLVGLSAAVGVCFQLPF